MIKDRIWTLVSRKLSLEATHSELIELSELIKGQGNANLYLQAMDEFWKIPPEKDEEFLEATYHLHLNRLKAKGFDLETTIEKEEFPSLYVDYNVNTARYSRKKKLLIAVSVITAVAFLFFISFYTQHSVNIPLAGKTAPSEISTKSGSRTKIQLPDGSSVWLNGGSKLVYDNRHFADKKREVTLTGEAYFDIVKNIDKPFIIHANGINIKVTGTVLNVKAYPGEKNTETSLIRGSIEVSTNDRKGIIQMKPNDKLIILNEAVQTKNNNPGNKKAVPVSMEPFISMSHLTLANDEITIVETAWVENRLVFDNETFEEVALKMERWYGVSMRFSDDKLKLQRLTGTFEKESVTEALQALQLSTPVFKYRFDNQRITIFK